MSKHVNPGNRSPLARHIYERVEALKGKKRQKDIAREAGFNSPNMISMLKNGDTKLALDRVPALARALETDLGRLFLLALEQSGLETTSAAVSSTFGTVVTRNEVAWLEEIRDASGRSDPPLTKRSRDQLRGIFK